MKQSEKWIYDLPDFKVLISNCRKRIVTFTSPYSNTVIYQVQYRKWFIFDWQNYEWYITKEAAIECFEEI